MPPKRLGLLIPSADVIVEQDFRNYLPRAIDYYVARMFQGHALDVGRANLNNMIDSMKGAAENIAHVDPDLVCFCCTSASFIGGHGSDIALQERISSFAKAPAVTTSSALVQALKAMGIANIYMLTPYPREFNEAEIAFLKSSGVEVKRHSSFDCRKSKDIPKITDDQIVDRVLSDRDAIAACDAVFISCTNLPAMRRAAELESALDKPVITSNSVTMWAALRGLQANMSEVHAGRLFTIASA